MGCHKTIAPVLTLPLWVLTAGLAFQTPQWTVFLSHAGPIRYGMTIGEARNALHDPKASGTPTGCSYLQSSALPDGIGLMLNNGRVVRVDVWKGSVRTPSGAGIGDTEQRIDSLYHGRIKVEEHPYTGPEGHYLIYTAADSIYSQYEMIFETDGAHVIMYRAGLLPAVKAIEGCS
jgi:hypothetical protein